MNWTRMCIIVVAIICLMVFISICINYNSGTEYEKGKIIVIFKGGIDEKNASIILEKYNLSIISSSVTYFGDYKNALDTIVRVPVGLEEYYVDLLLKEDAIIYTELLTIDK